MLAKVTRDRIMVELHERWPEYDFAGHKGYVTAVHSAALKRHGPCPEHRMRFVNVRSGAATRTPARGLQRDRARPAWSMMAVMSCAGADNRRLRMSELR